MSYNPNQYGNYQYNQRPSDPNKPNKKRTSKSPNNYGNHQYQQYPQTNYGQTPNPSYNQYPMGQGRTSFQAPYNPQYGYNQQPAYANTYGQQPSYNPQPGYPPFTNPIYDKKDKAYDINTINTTGTNHFDFLNKTPANNPQYGYNQPPAFANQYGQQPYQQPVQPPSKPTNYTPTSNNVPGNGMGTPGKFKLPPVHKIVEPEPEPMSDDGNSCSSDVQIRDVNDLKPSNNNNPPSCIRFISSQIMGPTDIFQMNSQIQPKPTPSIPKPPAPGLISKIFDPTVIFVKLYLII